MRRVPARIRAYVSKRQHTSAYVREYASILPLVRRVPARITVYSVSGLKLLVYQALSYWCMRPLDTGVCGLKLLVYEALRYWCMWPSATSACGLKLLVYEALSY